MFRPVLFYTPSKHPCCHGNISVQITALDLVFKIWIDSTCNEVQGSRARLWCWVELKRWDKSALLWPALMTAYGHFQECSNKDQEDVNPGYIDMFNIRLDLGGLNYKPLKPQTFHTQKQTTIELYRSIRFLSISLLQNVVNMLYL